MLATAVFLDLNGVEITRASNDDVYTFVMEVAAGQYDISDLASDLRRITEGD